MICSSNIVCFLETFLQFMISFFNKVSTAHSILEPELLLHKNVDDNCCINSFQYGTGLQEVFKTDLIPLLISRKQPDCLCLYSCDKNNEFESPTLLHFLLTFL